MADRKKKRKYKTAQFEEDYWAFYNNKIWREREKYWTELKKKPNFNKILFESAKIWDDRLKEQSKKPFHFVVKLMVGLVLLTFAAAVVIEGVSMTREMNDRPTDTITPITES